MKYFGFNLAMTFIGIIATVIRMSLIQCTREVPGKLLFFVRLIINLQISLEAKLMICKAKSTQPLLVEENAKIEGNEVQTMEETDPIRLDRIQNWDLITKCYQIILTILYILVYLVISFAFLV